MKCPSVPVPAVPYLGVLACLAEGLGIRATAPACLLG